MNDNNKANKLDKYIKYRREISQFDQFDHINQGITLNMIALSGTLSVLVKLKINLQQQILSLTHFPKKFFLF